MSHLIAACAVTELLLHHSVCIVGSEQTSTGLLSPTPFIRNPIAKVGSGRICSIARSSTPHRHTVQVLKSLSFGPHESESVSDICLFQRSTMYLTIYYLNISLFGLNNTIRD